MTRIVQIPINEATLTGELVIPAQACGIVLFAHDSGSSRHSPRNQFVARMLHNVRLATLLPDLLTEEETALDEQTHHLRFDIDLLARRLMSVTNWIIRKPQTQKLCVGYSGSGTGGSAALVAAAALKESVSAVVVRGGRPDLAGEALPQVAAPTLLIVGELDEVALHLHEEAFARLRCERNLKIIPGTTHLFEEQGKLAEVALLASQWFSEYLNPGERRYSSK